MDQNDEQPKIKLAGNPARASTLDGAVSDSNISKTKRPHVTILEMLLFFPCLIFAPRFSGLVVLIILALLYLLFPLHRSRRALIIATVAFVLCILSPVDIDAEGVYGPDYGSHKKGIRLVRLVHGLADSHGCLAKYGEFISGGCCGHGYDAIWILKWD